MEKPCRYAGRPANFKHHAALVSFGSETFDRIHQGCPHSLVTDRR